VSCPTIRAYRGKFSNNVEVQFILFELAFLMKDLLQRKLIKTNLFESFIIVNFFEFHIALNSSSFFENIDVTGL